MEQPQFTHDCIYCTFLGQYNNHDLYWCEQGGHPTLIARFGNNGPDYQSGAAFVGIIPEITEAGKRATERNLPFSKPIQ